MRKMSIYIESFTYLISLFFIIKSKDNYYIFFSQTGNYLSYFFAMLFHEETRREGICCDCK